MVERKKTGLAKARKGVRVHSKFSQQCNSPSFCSIPGSSDSPATPTVHRQSGTSCSSSPHSNSLRPVWRCIYFGYNDSIINYMRIIWASTSTQLSGTINQLDEEEVSICKPK